MNDVLSAKYITKIGTWNVRTAYSTGKLAQIINEMKTSDLHILGLAEMRWPNSGQLVSEDVTVLYSGGHKHEHGVGILMSREAAKSMISWEPVSNRIMTLRLRTRFTCATIVQVYAPTDSAADSDKDVFYQQLDAVMDSIPSYDMKILMGDFNAQIGPDTTGFENVIGKEALGQRTDNGDRLLGLYSNNNLKIGGSMFMHKRIHKGMWQSPDGVTVNQIDHFCISRRWSTAVQDVRAHRGPDVASDHYLVVAKLKMKLKQRKGTAKKTQAFDVAKLKHPDVEAAFNVEVYNRFAILEEADNVEDTWCQFKTTIVAAAEKVLGRKRGSRKERWISDTTWKAIDERKGIKKQLSQGQPTTKIYDELKCEYKTKDKEVKRRVKDKQQWYDSKASEAEEAANKGDHKSLYRIVKELTGQRTQSQQIKMADGRFARSHDELVNRWRDHFQAVLNCPDPTTTLDMDDTQASVQLPISVDPISEEEVILAIKQSKNGKSAGVDGIQLELLKYSDAAVPYLTDLCNMVWQQERAPADWKNGIIIPLPKKGDLSDCGNWRGITLLSVPGKLFSRVLLNRMQDAVDQLLRQQQAGFRRGRSCIDQIFTLRQIIEKVTEGRRPVIVNFIDFRKAFDSIHRPALWRILQQYGLPTKIVTVIQKLYEESSSAVRVNGDTSGWFQVETGVRQGCILSPLLFAIAIDWVLRRTTENSTGGITWSEDKSLYDLDFADDIALIDESWSSMQQTTSTLTKEANKVGLYINADKCKLMTTSVWSDRSDIQAAGADIEKVDDFCYLGSFISSNGSCEKDVKVRIGKAAAVFGKMKRIWRNDNISLKVRTRLYEAIILSTLLYGADVWPLSATLTKRLDAAHHRWQRSILGISWKDRITNVEVRNRTGQQTMDNILRERRLRWLGHVFRMDHQRIPQQALYWQTPGFKRGAGRPRANWRSAVNKDLQKMGLTWEEAEVAALDRHRWRRSVAQCVQLDAG